MLSAPFGFALALTSQALLGFVFFYPLFCAWCTWRRTRARPWRCAWARWRPAANTWSASTATPCWIRTPPLLVAPLIDNPRVGAVTGNPRIRTRSTLIGRIQVGEFSSIIGLIKRTQRVYGQVFTVSGVVAAFAARRWTGSATGAWT